MQMSAETSRTDLDVVNPSMHIAEPDECDCRDERIKQKVSSPTKSQGRPLDGMRTLPRISASHACTNFKDIYSEKDKRTETHDVEPDQAFTISSTKELKKSHMYNLQNTTAAGTSSEGS